MEELKREDSKQKPESEEKQKQPEPEDINFDGMHGVCCK
jgi:hypothetical protein